MDKYFRGWTARLRYPCTSNFGVLPGISYAPTCHFSCKVGAKRCSWPKSTAMKAFQCNSQQHFLESMARGYVKFVELNTVLHNLLGVDWLTGLPHSFPCTVCCNESCASNPSSTRRISNTCGKPCGENPSDIYPLHFLKDCHIGIDPSLWNQGNAKCIQGTTTVVQQQESTKKASGQNQFRHIHSITIHQRWNSCVQSIALTCLDHTNFDMNLADNYIRVTPILAPSLFKAKPHIAVHDPHKWRPGCRLQASGSSLVEAESQSAPLV